ncbi:VOC family protein [Virgibacillus byunsanensis]|uniref:VOC family protein n=1 Tax=Virgibacillus byunsanensis TaxID=570945 RepID=A0ABW3LS98_9BACI
MNVKEFGTILFVERYDQCVTFYRDILKLEVRNVKDSLVTFNISSGYLMVEKGGFGSANEKNRQQNPVVLRFDVDSLEESIQDLEDRGVIFSNRYLEFDWGKIAVFLDPDGNRIELGEINKTSGSHKE